MAGVSLGKKRPKDGREAACKLAPAHPPRREPKAMHWQEGMTVKGKRCLHRAPCALGAGAGEGGMSAHHTHSPYCAKRGRKACMDEAGPSDLHLLKDCGSQGALNSKAFLPL